MRRHDINDVAGRTGQDHSPGSPGASDGSGASGSPDASGIAARRTSGVARAVTIALIAAVAVALIAAAAYGFHRERRTRITIMAWGSAALAEQVERLGSDFASANKLDDDQVRVVHPEAGITAEQLSERIAQAQQQGVVALIASAASFDDATDATSCDSPITMYPDASVGADPAFSDAFAATVPNAAWRYFTCDGDHVSTVLDGTTDDHLTRRCERDDQRGSTICATDRGSTEYRPAASVKVLDADAAKQCEATGECAWEQTAMLQRYASTQQGLLLNRSRTWMRLTGGAAGTADATGSTTSAGTTADSSTSDDPLIAFYPYDSAGGARSATELNDQFARFLEFR
ncbi:hypothetical protein [Bifidobacterium biavatii]|uniref:Uncharacterized protein n=1 Tax=Bifidobacterium biavatii DSM 23969 TaxID=1437608 RepID=A0A086ZXE9_9BIFI|nr:hypothetical protein [Bifidobacterium biavatii]KFI51199.1 hypothetical protein BBIA_0761 [Bifidobacterium biavatii DSM 23969]